LIYEVSFLDLKPDLVCHRTELLPIGMHYGYITSCYALPNKFK